MIIAPSLLAADLSHLAKEVTRAALAGADWLHWDIMDGHFVPNLSFGPAVVEDVRSLTKLPFDVHLMCSRPEILVPAFAEAGANHIYTHVELGQKVTPLIWKIKSLGLKVGLAVNPPTAISYAEPYLEQIDQLLIMTVNPGFGGQEFISEMLPKIQQAAAWRSQRLLGYQIAVDGGLTLDTAAECAKAGADILVSGTFLFGHRQMKRAISKLRHHASRHAKHPQLPVPCGAKP